MKWLRTIFLELFGGCPGCRDPKRNHEVSTSYVHKNHRPIGNPPSER